MSLKKLELNKYYKYITTVGERAVVYNNRIDKELDLFNELDDSEKKMLKKIFLKLIKELDNVK
jgi:hypothetical protein|tara:strand:- start:764 stop:952 length:189 start_codon:yes stop_codon:yes gene_type:complete